MSTHQHVFLWGNRENYPRIITRYSSLTSPLYYIVFLLQGQLINTITRPRSHLPLHMKQPLIRGAHQYASLHHRPVQILGHHPVPPVLTSQHKVSKEITLNTQTSFTLSTLGKIFSRRQIDNNFSYFSQKTGFVISCKLSPMETVCMKYQNLFYGDSLHEISRHL